MTDKKFKSIMVRYVDNQKRDMYKLYNPDTKRFIMTRDIKWEDCKMTNPAEILEIFRNSHKDYLVTGI